MKTKSVLFSLLILLSLMFSFDTVNAQTSLEEYNYVTKGYKIQIESGLDMKKGYEFEAIDEKSTDIRSAKLNALHRVLPTGKKEIAAYLIIYNRTGNPTEYICVPHPQSSEEIMGKYWTQLYPGDGDASQRLQLIVYLLTTRVKW